MWACGSQGQKTGELGLNLKISDSNSMAPSHDSGRASTPSPCTRAESEERLRAGTFPYALSSSSSRPRTDCVS